MVARESIVEVLKFSLGTAPGQAPPTQKPQWLRPYVPSSVPLQLFLTFNHYRYDRRERLFCKDPLSFGRARATYLLSEGCQSLPGCPLKRGQ